MKFAHSAETVTFFRRGGFCFRTLEDHAIAAAQTAARAVQPIGFGERQTKAIAEVTTLVINQTYALVECAKTDQPMQVLVRNGQDTIIAVAVEVHAQFLRFKNESGKHIDVSAGRYYLNLLVRFGVKPAQPSMETVLQSIRRIIRELPDTGTRSDDLKSIRGIGVLIEKKLQSLGITRWTQIANWTQADIDRVSNVLDFKGRIEREQWVEQARILAGGGMTEFSRRTDRDDAKTFKPAPQPSTAASASSVAAAAYAAYVATRATMGTDSSNLQRIGGITAAYEKILNACGITTIRQIAEWSEYDLAVVSRHLCIQRGVFAQMHWREQAQHLIKPEGENHAQMTLHLRSN